VGARSATPNGTSHPRPGHPYVRRAASDPHDLAGFSRRLSDVNEFDNPLSSQSLDLFTAASVLATAMSLVIELTQLFRTVPSAQRCASGRAAVTFLFCASRAALGQAKTGAAARAAPEPALSSLLRRSRPGARLTGEAVSGSAFGGKALRRERPMRRWRRQPAQVHARGIAGKYRSFRISR
jgi:hypothetical protein